MVPSDRRLRVVFIGKDWIFTHYPLEEIAKRHEVVGFIESAPRAMNSWVNWFLVGLVRTYHRIARIDDLATIIRRLGIPSVVMNGRNHDEIERFLRGLYPDVCCVASSSHILPPSIIRIPHYGTLNVHPSLLPRYRGSNPWFWTIYNNDTEGGVTVHVMDGGIDSGDILTQASFPIENDLDARDFVKRASNTGARILVMALEALVAGNVHRIPQDSVQASMAPNVGKEYPPIDWESWDIERIYHILKGTWVWYSPAISPCIGNILGWRCSSAERSTARRDPGRLGIDWKGFFISHPQGKIRVKPYLSMKRLLS